jgi:transposase InsO family protein
MIEHYPTTSLSRLCHLLGISRQAYYQHTWNWQQRTAKEEVLIHRILEIRQKQPAIGGRKLYILLQEEIKQHGLQMGRDAFFNMLSAYNLLVKKRVKRKVITTMSRHRFHKYPNLIRYRNNSYPNQVWVADITYITKWSGFYYLSLITDEYSRKIVGYCLSDSLQMCHTCNALKMALAQLKTSVSRQEMIHHSDRGVQYCSNEYIKLLKEHNILISMTQSSDPLETAIAERVNGILETEFLAYMRIPDKLDKAQKVIADIIYTYNHYRPHMSLEWRTPAQIYESEGGELIRQWYDYQTYKDKKINQITTLQDSTGDVEKL